MSLLNRLVRSRLAEELVPVKERDEIMEPLAAPARFNRVQIVAGMRRSGKMICELRGERVVLLGKAMLFS